MKNLPLNLGVGNFSDAEKRALKPPDKSQIEKTLKRNDSSCRFCGFKSTKYQRVIPYIDEPNAAKFVTVCSFCEQVLNLERSGITGVGVLIWLPEITQSDLNHIIRAIYIARESDELFSKTASRALDALMTRRIEAKKRLGSDDPLLLATVVCEALSKDEYKKSLDKIEGIRLLPADKYLIRTSQGDIDQFPKMVEFWTSEDGPFSQFPVDKWVELFERANESAGHA